MKQTAPIIGRPAIKEILLGSYKYLGLKVKPSKKGKLVYAKVMVKTKDGFRFASVKRQRMHSIDDLKGALEAIMVHVEGGNYGDDAAIVGYEIEEVLE